MTNVYPTPEGPDLFQSYSGAKKYVMHFKKGELPPVNGFWSLTMEVQESLILNRPIQLGKMAH